MDNYIVAIKNAFSKIKGDFSPENIAKKAEIAGLNPDEYSISPIREYVVRVYNLGQIVILNLGPFGEFLCSSIEIKLTNKYGCNNLLLKLTDVSISLDIKAKDILFQVLKGLDDKGILPLINDFENSFPLCSLQFAEIIGCE